MQTRAKRKSAEIEKTHTLTQQSGKPPLLIITHTKEKDPAERHEMLFDSVEIYEKLGYHVLNTQYGQDYDKCRVLFNNKVLSVPKNINDILKSQYGKEVVLVLVTHGDLHKLFAEYASNEGSGIVNFSRSIKRMVAHYGIKVSNVVIDACLSASELKEPDKGMFNASPARILSELLPDIRVYGFNGNATLGGYVTTVNAESKSGTSQYRHSYADNCVIFQNGDVLKGSSYKKTTRSMSNGLFHTIGIEIEPHYANISANISSDKPKSTLVIDGEEAILVRSNSFSDKLSPPEPQYSEMTHNALLAGPSKGHSK